MIDLLRVFSCPAFSTHVPTHVDKKSSLLLVVVVVVVE
ncbi:hypothetical protein [Polaromonas sp. CG9_12]|nr:hypothetical protein [Polaromonas sp. CG9_12]